MAQTMKSPFAAPFGVITRHTEDRTEVAVVPPTISEPTLRQVQARLLWDDSITRVLAKVSIVGAVLIGATLIGTVSGVPWLSRVSLSHGSEPGRLLSEALVAVATTPLADTAQELVRFETAAVVRRITTDTGAAETAAHHLWRLAGHAQPV